MIWALESTDGHYCLTYNCEATTMPILTTAALHELDLHLSQLATDSKC